MIAAIRKVTDIPVAVGFGINTTDQAANIAKLRTVSSSEALSSK